MDAHLCVKVADFGLSRIKCDLHPLTGGLGTYQWMAPEVISHSRYTESADVYSFGIVLWECAARQVPYPGQPGFSAAVGVMTRCFLTLGQQQFKRLGCLCGGHPIMCTQKVCALFLTDRYI